MANKRSRRLTLDGDAGLTLPLEQVEGLVQEQASFEAAAVSITSAAAVPGPSATTRPTAPISRALRETAVRSEAELGAIEISIVPENVTDVGKTAATASVEPEQTIVVGQKDTLASILGKLGASEAEIDAIAKALGDAATSTRGQRLRVLVEPVREDDGRGRPVRLSVYNADAHTGTVALVRQWRLRRGRRPPESPRPRPPNAGGDDDGDDDNSGGIRLYNSIYETALKQDVPKEMIDGLMRIYAYDVDLNRRTRPGDTFELFYEQDEQRQAGRRHPLHLPVDRRRSQALLPLSSARTTARSTTTTSRADRPASS